MSFLTTSASDALVVSSASRRLHATLSHLTSQIDRSMVHSSNLSSSRTDKQTQTAKSTLAEFLNSLPASSIGPDQSLPHLLLHIAAAVATISKQLRASTVEKINSSNQFGDEQLNVDVQSHAAVLTHLRDSGVCATASSEEEPIRIDLSDGLRPHCGRERVLSVAFDPLDGSSIIDANFAVGSIFSVFEGREFIGKRINEQKACAIAQYGPRTSIIFGLPSGAFEVTLALDGFTWLLTRPSMRLAPNTKTFAPANLRCAAQDKQYNQLIQFYIDNKYTLRYSGGLVPDFYHALVKGSGVFISPVSKSAKAKLRLLYEVSCLSMLSVWADGAAVDENGVDLTQRTISDYDTRSGLIIGSKTEVQRYCDSRRK